MDRNFTSDLTANGYVNLCDVGINNDYTTVASIYLTLQKFEK